MARAQSNLNSEATDIDWSVVAIVFSDLLAELNMEADLPEGLLAVDFSSIINGLVSSGQNGLNEGVSQEHDLLAAADIYGKRLSVDMASSPNGHVFINGKHFNLDDVSHTFIA